MPRNLPLGPVAGGDVTLCAELWDGLEESVRAAGLATAAADDLELRAYELRLDVAHRLRALGVGFGDIGELIGIHPHRVRVLLA